MAVTTIDAELLARMFLAGAQNLEANKELINELNVFPVPDGDTGTNMGMTIMSAVGEIRGLQQINMKDLAKAISSGSLRGARGNSGVILSQLFRGFTKTVKGADQIDTAMIADGFEKAVETAYKAVIKPKEGTILTVAKRMSEIARKLQDAQLPLEEYAKAIIEYGNQTLERTPEMLPVLKEAGVVDSGGKGLMCFMEGAYDVLIGKEVDLSFGEEKKEVQAEPEVEEIRFGYCMDLTINGERPVPGAQIEDYHNFLTNIGESVVLVPEGCAVRVHVHTNDPGLVLTRALTMGQLTGVAISNMHLEHQEKQPGEAREAALQMAKEAAKKANPMKPCGFVAVAAGEGFAEIFRELGADCVIEGGQTMNPSTEDVLNAIDQVNAENVFLYPNNKNIIMAANQAKELVREKNVIVIPTKTVPQGISALLAFEPNKSVEQNAEDMNEIISLVRTAEITYAIRDTKIGKDEIHQGDIMAVGDDGILAVGKEILDTAVEAADRMAFEDAALISIYFGKDYSEENANRIAQEIRSRHPDLDVEVNNGGQPVYYCIISAE